MMKERTRENEEKTRKKGPPPLLLDCPKYIVPILMEIR